MRYDMTKFREIEPLPPVRPNRLTVSDVKKVRVSLKIAEQTQFNVRLFVGEKGNSVMVMAGGDTPVYKIRKSLELTAEAFVAALRAEGVTIPATYEMAYHEDGQCWIGERIDAPAQVVVKKTPRKPRKQGLKAMVPTP